MAKEITPVLFFGYDNRFVPASPILPAKHDDADVDSAAVMGSVRKMDFRPQPIQTPVAQPVEPDEEQVEVPKASSVTEPAGDSGTGSPTSPSASPEGPASVEKGKTETPLVPPLL